jgi:hypothetical protein
MNGKFSTTSSSLFNNKNPEQVPDWMQNLSELELKKKENLNLEINAKGAFAEKTTINRDERVGSPRELEASLSDTRLITDAKINLAKFLTGKYYKVEGKVYGNNVKLNVKIDAIPAEFTFDFSAPNGKVANNDTFTIMTNSQLGEYPFSKAGLEECISDIKNNKSKTAKKVESVGKYSLINKEEIIRRYNGHLRLATDRINELLTEGSIIGVGSNTFASTYDVEYLFPQMEKEAMEAPLPAFEFAPNQEHVAAQEHKTAEALIVDASKILANNFSDFKILNSERNNDNLLVTAKVLDNGLTRTVTFNFGIKNEKILAGYTNIKTASNNLVTAYANKNNTQKRLTNGSIFTRQLITEKLHKVVRAGVVNSLIDNWIERGLVTPIADNSFVTENTFQDLLASVNTKILTANEIEEINSLSNKAAEFEFDRIEQADTGVREYDEIEVSNELCLNTLKSELNKSFKNFKLANFQHENDNYKADLIFIHPQTGVENKLNVIAEFEGSRITSLLAEIKGQKYSVTAATGMFSKSATLTAYLQDNKVNTVEGSIVISERNLRTKLAAFVETDKISSIIDNWYQNGWIKNTASGTYTSDYRIEDLLSHSGIEILSEADRKQITLAKSYFGEGLGMSRQAVNDTGVREPEAYTSDETLLVKANDFIAQHFNSFKPDAFKVQGENVNYSVILFDNKTGLSTNINFNMVLNGDKIASCHANLNGEKVDLKNIKKAFASNEVLNKYIELNPGKRTNAPMLMTVNQVVKNLSTIAKLTLGEANEIIDTWEKTGKIDRINSNVFGSKHTFEQLLSMSKIKPLNDSEIKEKLEKSIRNKNLMVTTGSYIQDSDTRTLVDNWSVERMTLHAKTELNRIFKDYHIIDADANEDSYIVAARVVNPITGLRQKLTFTFAMINGKPGQISKVASSNKTADLNNIADLAVVNGAINTFLQYNNPVDRSGKYIITKTQLNNLIHPIADKTDINKIIDSLTVSDVLNPITSETYASDYSASEIIANLDTLGLTNLEVGKEQIENAKRDENTLKITDARTMNNDTRAIEATEKVLSPKMQQLKEKIHTTAVKAQNNKVITANKLNQIDLMLNVAKTENDLELAWKELKKYFN